MLHKVIGAAQEATTPAQTTFSKKSSLPQGWALCRSCDRVQGWSSRGHTGSASSGPSPTSCAGSPASPLVLPPCGPPHAHACTHAHTLMRAHTNIFTYIHAHMCTHSTSPVSPSRSLIQRQVPWPSAPSSHCLLRGLTALYLAWPVTCSLDPYHPACSWGNLIKCKHTSEGKGREKN